MLFRSVKVEKIAFSNSRGEGSLYFDIDGSPLASLVKRDLSFIGITNLRNEIVTFDTIDSYCEANKVIPTILKLDVEGHELTTLEGAKKALPKIAVVQFEFGGANKDSRTFFYDFYNLFRDSKFDLYRISPSKLVKIPHYSEFDEHFRTTNFVATNSQLVR